MSKSGETNSTGHIYLNNYTKIIYFLSCKTMGIEGGNTYERIKDGLQKGKGGNILESFNGGESAGKIDGVNMPYIGIMEESLSVQYCSSNIFEIGNKIAEYLYRVYGPKDDKNETFDSINKPIKELKGRKIRTEKPKPNKVKPKRVKRNTPNATPILPTLEKDEK